MQRARRKFSVLHCPSRTERLGSEATREAAGLGLSARAFAARLHARPLAEPPAAAVTGCRTEAREQDTSR